jgi:hypothetical protein
MLEILTISFLIIALKKFKELELIRFESKLFKFKARFS